MCLRQGTVAAAVMAVLLALVPAAAAKPLPWRAGAARVDTTPPPPGSDDPAEFGACPAALYDGPRPFAFNEPYQDQNGDGRFEYPEPYCDADHNGRYDGIYSSGGVDHLATGVHDPIDARAISISDGTHALVVVSVVAQGLFQNYTQKMRDLATAARPGITGMIVSANHNESSPDTIGIYGAPADPSGSVGANSGIDDYYMHWLEQRVADAAVKAYDAMRPARLAARQFPLPPTLSVRLSHNFPTTDDNRQPAAIDPKVGVLQASDSAGSPIFTVLSLAAHNQEIGHSHDDSVALSLSSDWPGWFHQRIASLGGGMGMFLVGDNGSEEDPETVPPVDPAAHPECATGCYAQAEATGEALADAVAAEAPKAAALRPGVVSFEGERFYAPLENNLFRAAEAAGLFGERQGYTAGAPSGRVGTDLLTEVGVAGIGPDLQLIANPGEAFPALMLGSPWGIDDAGCPDRPNPPVPTWHGYAPFRFQVGLANDMIGYLIPAWAYSSQPGTFTTGYGDDATCVNDADDRDPKGHQHKLETEGVGPTPSNLVAEKLTELLDRHPDPAAQIRLGRFIRPDGSLSRRADGAVGVWLADPGSTSLSPGSGTIVALQGVTAFGSRKVDRTGAFMDYDGDAQSGADITTRGMAVGGRRAARYYVNVYPALSGGPLGPAAQR